MSYEFITTEKKGHILVVTMNRPEVYNAVHVDMQTKWRPAGTISPLIRTCGSRC
jgi:enoyl-CoA hydratase/carnithine racemase